MSDEIFLIVMGVLLGIITLLAVFGPRLAR